MMQNSLYVNLLLTGLVTSLACFPQPLLRSFLLSHTLVFQPSVKSLLQVRDCHNNNIERPVTRNEFILLCEQVLASVRHKVDAYAGTVKDFDALMLKARQFLAWRESSSAEAAQNQTRLRSDSNISIAPGQLKRECCTVHVI